MSIPTRLGSRMADGITECSYITIERRKECQYYGKVSYKDSEDCTHRRTDGSCFIGGIESGYEKTEEKADG